MRVKICNTCNCICTFNYICKIIVLFNVICNVLNKLFKLYAIHISVLWIQNIFASHSLRKLRLMRSEVRPPNQQECKKGAATKHDLAGETSCRKGLDIFPSWKKRRNEDQFGVRYKARSGVGSVCCGIHGVFACSLESLTLRSVLRLWAACRGPAANVLPTALALLLLFTARYSDLATLNI